MAMLLSYGLRPGRGAAAPRASRPVPTLSPPPAPRLSFPCHEVFRGWPLHSPGLGLGFLAPGWGTPQGTGAPARALPPASPEKYKTCLGGRSGRKEAGLVCGGPERTVCLFQGQDTAHAPCQARGAEQAGKRGGWDPKESSGSSAAASPAPRARASPLLWSLPVPCLVTHIRVCPALTGLLGPLPWPPGVSARPLRWSRHVGQVCRSPACPLPPPRTPVEMG